MEKCLSNDWKVIQTDRKGKKKKNSSKEYNSDFLKNFCIKGLIHTFIIYPSMSEIGVLNTCYRVILCPNMGKNFQKIRMT